MEAETTAAAVEECVTEETVIAEETEEAAAPTDLENELCELREQVKQLTAELEKRQAQQDRAAAQIEEFSSLFPDASVSTVPEEVWESVRSGNSLAAAYALYTRRVEAREAQVRSVNEKNASHSTGKAGRGTAEEYFTPDEVRAMSQSQVRANYSKIIESMKKWN